MSVEPLAVVARPLTGGRLRADPRVWLALPTLLSIVVLAMLADVVAPFDPNRQSLTQNLQPPSLVAGTAQPPHLAGTDHLGRDVLSRTLHGARLSLLIGLVTAGLAAVAGVTVGLVAGYAGGPLGALLMRLADVQIAFPFLVLAIAVIAAVGPSATAVVVTLALWGWVPFARLVRAEVMRHKQREYVEALRVLGGSSRRIVLLHILPNISSPILVQLTFFVGIALLSEGALSFLGLGVQPPDPSWGRMMAEGRSRLAIAWWITLTPGIALSLTVLSVNLLGDALTDALNPRTTR